VNARETWLLRILLLYSFLVMISFDVVLLVVVRVMKAVQDPSRLCFVGLFDQEGPNSVLVNITFYVYERESKYIYIEREREKEEREKEERRKREEKEEREKEKERS
jgi:hypothetical protein